MSLKKHALALSLTAALSLGLLSGCGSDSSANVLNVYNWGEYIDTDLIDQFEAETGIKVIYNTFDSNENLYSRIQTTSYDVIIPSDYAISRFIDEDMLQPLNFDNIPNMKYIDEKYTHLDFDPEQKYSVPYTWGVVGIVYNTKYVDEADIGSWDLLWNPKYANRTAMFNNSRDALGIALMYLGCSLNTTDKDELRQAADLIIAGKPVYQGIWMDQILEKLPAEEIIAAPYYNGDAVTMIDENPDLAFYVPKEGTNLFVDAMCIPKNAKNVEGAEKFINFMCSTEAAMANWEYIGYSSPHTGVYEQLDGNGNPIPDTPVQVVCVVTDATACCAQGLEFVCRDDKTYPDDYPELNAEITVTGAFEIYEKNGHIAIDCGCVCGGRLAAYCIETGMATYVDGMKLK